MTSEDHPHTLFAACLPSPTCYCPSRTVGSMETCIAWQSFVVYRRPGVPVVIQGFEPSFLLHRLVLTTHQKKGKLTLLDATYLCFNDQITPVGSPKSQTFGILLRYFFWRTFFFFLQRTVVKLSSLWIYCEYLAKFLHLDYDIWWKFKFEVSPINQFPFPSS